MLAPGKAENVRSPTNAAFLTATTKQLIREQGSTQYDQDGKQMIIMTPNAESPLAITCGETVVYTAGASPQLYGHGSVRMRHGNNEAPWRGFINVGPDRMLVPIREPGFPWPFYKVTAAVGTQKAIAVVDRPADATLVFHQRNAMGIWSETTSTIDPTNGIGNFVFANGNTAFAVTVRRRVAGVNRNDVVSTASVYLEPTNGSAALTIGNHAQFLRRLYTNNFASFQVEDARVVAQEIVWSFRDAPGWCTGDILVCQMPPGVFHTDFEGDSVYAQVAASRYKSQKQKAVIDGASLAFAFPGPEVVTLNNGDGPTLADTGYAMIFTDGRNSNSNTPVKFTAESWFHFEYTTANTVATPQHGAYASFGLVQHEMFMMSVFNPIGENPVHEHVLTLWEHFKSKAKSILTNPKLWDGVGQAAVDLALLI